MLDVNDAFTLIDNRWGNPDAQQRVWVNDDDGSYGWEFDASGTDAGINYPEVFLGTRPWGSNTGVAEFPIRRGDVDEFVLDVQVDSSITGGEWDLAHEWWLMDEKPSVQTKTYQYEVMLLLDWGGGHDHGAPIYTDLWTDRYGNTIDLWALYDAGGTSATFYIFRVQGGHTGGKIDVSRIVDWLTSHEGISRDLWISGCELGNEYWPEAVGRTTFDTFDVTINGTTYTSGRNASGTGGGEDFSAPSAPSKLSSPRCDESSTDLSWEASSDAGGSGVAQYAVYADGVTDHRVAAPATSTTVSGLEAGTNYEFAVTAVDGAGNESAPSNVVSVTTDSGAGDGSSDDVRSGAVYRLRNVNSGQVLNATATTPTTDGVTLCQQPWAGEDRQRWTLVDNGDGTYRIAGTNGCDAVGVDGGSTSQGADVVQGPWDGGDAQRWRLVKNGDGTHRIQNAGSGFVLDVEGGSTANGANVLQWAWHGGANQRWVLAMDAKPDAESPTAPSNLASPRNDGTSVDLRWDAATDGDRAGVTRYEVYVDGAKRHHVTAGTTATTVAELTPGTNYEFAVTAIDGAGNESAPSNAVTVATDRPTEGESSDALRPGATYRLRNENSGMALCVEGGSTADGATLVQRPPGEGDDAQRWTLVDVGDGTYRLRNANSGDVADVSGGSTTEGTDVLQWPWHGGANQRWTPVDNGDGTYRLRNANSGLVLDVAGAATSSGANVQQWAWNGGANQRWALSLDEEV